MATHPRQLGARHRCRARLARLGLDVNWFVHVVYGLGFTTLFFRNYYEAFPTELVKAAQIDGAGFFQIFRRIMLPNSVPIIVVTRDLAVHQHLERLPVRRRPSPAPATPCR